MSLFQMMMSIVLFSWIEFCTSHINKRQNLYTFNFVFVNHFETQPLPNDCNYKH